MRFKQNIAINSDTKTTLGDLQPDQIIGVSKERTIVNARALVCYRAVRELGMTMTDVGKHIGTVLSTVSIAVNKGEKTVRDERLNLMDLLNINI